jgi:hypothetical protein
MNIFPSVCKQRSDRHEHCRAFANKEVFAPFNSKELCRCGRAPLTNYDVRRTFIETISTNAIGENIAERYLAT